MQLTKEQHDILVDWIVRYLTPIKTINTKIDTSDICKAFMDTYEYGFYLDNDSVNKVMLELGYCAIGFSSAPYLNFNVSSKSPALREYRQWVLNLSTFQKYE